MQNVTYSDLFAFCLVIIGAVSLVLQAVALFKNKKK